MEGLYEPYRQHPTVYAAVSAIANSLSSVPLEMFPDSDEKHETPVDDSIVMDLLERPNESMEWNFFFNASLVFYEFCGEVFWLKDGTARRTAMGPRFPTALRLWDPKKVYG